MEALLRGFVAATPEPSAMSRTIHPRYRMAKNLLRRELGWYREANLRPYVGGGFLFRYAYNFKKFGGKHYGTSHLWTQRTSGNVLVLF